MAAVVVDADCTCQWAEIEAANFAPSAAMQPPVASDRAESVSLDYRQAVVVAVDLRSASFVRELAVVAPQLEVVAFEQYSCSCCLAADTVVVVEAAAAVVAPVVAWADSALCL